MFAFETALYRHVMRPFVFSSPASSPTDAEALEHSAYVEPSLDATHLRHPQKFTSVLTECHAHFYNSRQSLQFICMRTISSPKGGPEFVCVFNEFGPVAG